MTGIYFFDIDNTLLDHRTGVIPASAIAAIVRLRAAGHTIVVATGRSHGHARRFIEEIEPHYAITQNGARILRGGTEVLAIPLAREPLVRLFDWMHGQGHFFGANDGEIGYLSAAAASAVGPLGGVKMAFQTDHRFYLERDIYQGWLFFDEALDAVLMPQIRERFPEFGLVRWHPTAVDVMPAAVNKWTGCQWVMAQSGFHPRQAVAFGDGLNDVEMLQGVGLGIAMDNGHPQLKAIAQRIAPALHLDGIATMLDELAQGKDRGLVAGCPPRDGR